MDGPSLKAYAVQQQVLLQDVAVEMGIPYSTLSARLSGGTDFPQRFMEAVQRVKAREMKAQMELPGVGK